MPFVAGIDRFLPDAFGRIHPKHGSPYVAVILQAVIAAAFALMSFVGASVQEAYLVLLDTTLLVYFVPYGYLFAAHVIVRRQDLAPWPDYRFLKSRRLAQLAGVCGLITTLLAMALALVPPEDTDNALLFEVKVIGGFLAFLGVGGLVYWLSTQAPRRNS
jgi:amino acid transporter